MIITARDFKPIGCEFEYVNQYAYVRADIRMLNTGFYFEAVALPKGDYHVIVDGNSAHGCGVLRWHMDDVMVEPWQDWYADVYEKTATTRSFELRVATSGNHLFKALITGKNASATFFHWAISAVEITPIQSS